MIRLIALFVLIGYADIGRYGAEGKSTPNMDSLASKESSLNMLGQFNWWRRNLL